MPRPQLHFHLAVIGLRVVPIGNKDAARCHSVFYDAVRNGTAPLYSAQQRAAWAPDRVVPHNWCARLEGQHSYVAKRFGRILGFVSLGSDGHLDLLYVSPRWHRTPVADRLYRAVERTAMELELSQMTTEASLLAQPFLERRGWTTLAHQHVIRNGVVLANARMEKWLPKS